VTADNGVGDDNRGDGENVGKDCRWRPHSLLIRKATNNGCARRKIKVRESRRERFECGEDEGGRVSKRVSQAGDRSEGRRWADGRRCLGIFGLKDAGPWLLNDRRHAAQGAGRQSIGALGSW
jgi:hypothetical protein